MSAYASKIIGLTALAGAVAPCDLPLVPASSPSLPLAALASLSPMMLPSPPLLPADVLPRGALVIPTAPPSPKGLPLPPLPHTTALVPPSK